MCDVRALTDEFALISCRYEQQKQAYEAGYSAAFLRKDISPSSIQQGGGASGSGSGSGAGSSGVSVGAVPISPVLARHKRRKKDPDMPRRNMYVVGVTCYSIVKPVYQSHLSTTRPFGLPRDSLLVAHTQVEVFLVDSLSYKKLSRNRPIEVVYFPTSKVWKPL